ncbi:hypothetical protein LOD99_14456 [Oopsacas minuta]|uniref:Uncharacterized protein n=1 Tax=Oopsacas minuta TaxID=111878 RepID=A0AAV7KEA8_9METZ|nr:hypothetical protein LOD99_14456 [Oopsacas minuta]
MIKYLYFPQAQGDVESCVRALDLILDLAQVSPRLNAFRRNYTREASQTEHVMCPSQVSTVVKIGDDFKFIEKQKIEDLRNSEIIVTNSIESQTSINSNSSHKRRIPADAPEDCVVDMNIKKSRPSNDLNLEESLGKVRQDTENIINAGPQELRMVESSERSNLSDKSSMPSEVERSSSHKSYPNLETERTSVRRRLPSDSMNDQDSDKSMYVPKVSDELRDRYQDGPRDLQTPSLDSVLVNSIMGTIHEKTQVMANSSTEERSDHCSYPSVWFPGPFSVLEAGFNSDEIGWTEGISFGQHHIYKGENAMLVSDCIPSSNNFPLLEAIIDAQVQQQQSLLMSGFYPDPFLVSSIRNTLQQHILVNVKISLH